MASRFAVAGLIPGGLVAWETYAYYRRRVKQEELKGVGFLEGSMEWQIENEVSSLDLVVTRRSAWSEGPLRLLASRGTPGYNSVGVAICDRSGETRILEADMDGSVTMRSLAATVRDPDANEVAIRPLVWPRADRDRVESAASLFAAAAMLQCSAEKAPRLPWRAARDERFAPLLQPRAAWPDVPADAPLDVKLDRAVSPAAALVLELYCSLGLIPDQYKGQPMLASDFATGDPPLRKGARFAPILSLKESNAVPLDN